jgi:AcrR family transcriptional regulator
VQEAQRTRVLEAIAEAMAERGARGGTVTVTDVLARSGVSDAGFHEAFADREACLLAAFELGVDRARTRMLASYDSHLRWLDAVKGGLAAFLRFLEDEPALGRLLVVYSTSGGERLLRRRAEILESLAALIDRGRLELAADRQQPAAIIGEGVVGAVLTIIQNRLLADEQPPVMELFGALVSIIVLPYLGAGVAHREMTRPAPRARADGAPAPSASEDVVVRGRGLRMTDRTALVLTAIADYPGASNREVADRAGVIDQGQISKLLSRLHERELIANTGDGRTRGAPNAWRLTEHGEALLGGIAASRS